MKTPTLHAILTALPLCVLLVPAMPVMADALDKAITLSDTNNSRERDTQQKIDRLSEQTRVMLEEYLTLSRELDSLTVYNDQLQRLVASQDEEKSLIAQQMADIELTQREIVPLMLRMIGQLDSFVTDDMPFLQEERRQRVTLLRRLMDRADVSVAEKYRRVLEAYQIELDYSRTLEAYQEDINDGKQPLTVDVLRVGRLGLYYVTLDGHEAAYWDAARQNWTAMDAAGRLSVTRALRIARQQTAPQLLDLPIAAASRDDAE
ncbi:MAG TPA: DUF3450 domain-containing protein [Gammaproteobacteria bacterium]|nr:DUF3450 domain-containing protein [Gammaproteobacteria bacterium]